MEGESVYKEIEELVKEQEQQLIIQDHNNDQHNQFRITGIDFCDQQQISLEDQLDQEHVHIHDNSTRIIEEHVNQVMQDTAKAINQTSIHEEDKTSEIMTQSEQVQNAEIEQPQNVEVNSEQQNDVVDNEASEETKPVTAENDVNNAEETNKEEPVLEICRVCLSDDKENLQCIFSGGVSEQVRTVAAVDLDKDDGLPQFICFDCRQDLAIAVKFKTKCESSDTELRNKLGIKMKTVVKTELVLLDCDDVQVISDNENQNKKRRHESSSDDEYHENFYQSDDPDFNIEEEEEERVLRKKKSTPRRSRKNRDSFKAAIYDNVEITIKKSSDGSYPCPFCFRAFQYPSTLKLHLPTHRNKMSKCVLCAKTFVSQKELYDHYKHDHPKECSKAQSNKSLNCDTCDITFTSKSSLKAHEATHVGTNKYKCQKCPQSFNNLTSLNLHKKQDHHSVKKPYTCKVCSKRFKHTSSLEKHMENHKYMKTIKLPPQKLEPEHKPMSTKDLFKSIAPVTTTYWSDSFSD